MEVHSSLERKIIGPYSLDVIHHVLMSDAGSIQLSPLASRFLQVLARTPGEIVDRTAIIEELWRGDYLVGEQALNRVVSEIRQAVGDDARKPQLIQTVHRRGYRLLAMPAETSPAQTRRSGENAWSWRPSPKFLWAAFGIIVATVAIKLILDTAMGVLWTAAH